ncbi:MAG TPA: YggT family protein [Acidimicrobiia bacterium]|nr:YggT family protein [Acidimicrobiia bacterium]
MTFLCTLIDLYVLVLFGRIILSFFEVPSDHPVGRIRSILASLTDPVLIPLRRVIPPVRMGPAALDLSPLVVLLGLSLLRSVVC